MATGERQEDAASRPRLGRVSVNVTRGTQAALDRLADREDVTVTEALRRLIGYGNLVYQVTQIDGDEIMIRRGDAFERVVLI